MSNELQPLSGIFDKRIFRIPDYQRGYAWLQPQLVDFWEDLVNLQPERNHYTGLLSLKPLNEDDSKDWNDAKWAFQKGYKPCHIVDGQQRLTTFVILLHEIVKFVREINKEKSDSEILLGDDTVKDVVTKYICIKNANSMITTTYLFGYEKDNPSAEYMKYKVLEDPLSKDVTETYYTKNLIKAKEFFANNISNLYKEAGANGIETINILYKKLTHHLMFNLHEIDDNYDVFVAFETMNNRGKKLTNLELLKNRLIYLTTLYDAHELDDNDKYTLRETINNAWKEIYKQLGRNKEIPLSDDDFLRAHWINYFKYSRRRGSDYISFLLKNFSSKGIFEKTSVTLEREFQSVISDDISDLEDSDSTDFDVEQEVLDVLANQMRLHSVEFSKCNMGDISFEGLNGRLKRAGFTECGRLDFKYPEVPYVNISASEIDFENIDFEKVKGISILKSVIKNGKNLTDFEHIERVVLDGTKIYAGDEEKTDIEVSKNTKYSHKKEVELVDIER